MRSSKQFDCLGLWVCCSGQLLLVWAAEIFLKVVQVSMADCRTTRSLEIKALARNILPKSLVVLETT